MADTGGGDAVEMERRVAEAIAAVLEATSGAGSTRGAAVGEAIENLASVLRVARPEPSPAQPPLIGLQDAKVVQRALVACTAALVVPNLLPGLALTPVNASGGESLRSGADLAAGTRACLRAWSHPETRPALAPSLMPTVVAGLIQLAYEPVGIGDTGGSVVDPADSDRSGDDLGPSNLGNSDVPTPGTLGRRRRVAAAVVGLATDEIEPTGPGGGGLEMSARDRQRFGDELRRLLTEAHPMVVFQTLTALIAVPRRDGPAAPKPPPWFRAVCGRLLSDALVRGGLATVLEHMLADPNAADSDVSAAARTALRAARTSTASPLPLPLAAQIIGLLRAPGPTGGGPAVGETPILRRAAVWLVTHLLDDCPDLAKGRILDPLLRPLDVFFGAAPSPPPGSTAAVVVTGEAAARLVSDLCALLEPHEPHPLLLSSLAPLVDPLFQLYAAVAADRSPASQDLAAGARYALSQFLRTSSRAAEAVVNWIAPPQRVTDPRVAWRLMSSDSVEAGAGAGVGARLRVRGEAGGAGRVVEAVCRADRPILSGVVDDAASAWSGGDSPGGRLDGLSSGAEADDQTIVALVLDLVSSVAVASLEARVFVGLFRSFTNARAAAAAAASAATAQTRLVVDESVAFARHARLLTALAVMAETVGPSLLDGHDVVVSFLATLLSNTQGGVEAPEPILVPGVAGTDGSQGARLEIAALDTEAAMLALGILETMVSAGGLPPPTPAYDALRSAVAALANHPREELAVASAGILDHLPAAAAAAASSDHGAGVAGDGVGGGNLDSGGDDGSQDEIAALLRDLSDPLLPVRAYAIDELRLRVLARHPWTVTRGPHLKAVFCAQLASDDDYLYLTAVRGLAALADADPETYIPEVTAVFEDPTRPVDFRLKVGETIVRIARRCGETLPAHADPLLDPMLRTAHGGDDPRLRESSVSALGTIAFLLGASLERYGRAIAAAAVEAAMRDPDAHVRRAGVYTLVYLVRTLRERLFDRAPGLLNPIYDALRAASVKDADATVRGHAERGLDILNSAVRDTLFPADVADSPLKFL